MTFSLVARCPETGLFGVAISSSSPAVAARAASLHGPVSALSRARTLPIHLWARRFSISLNRVSGPAEAVESVSDGTPFAAYRQILAVGCSGAPAIFSGENALGLWAEVMGNTSCAAGNLLANPNVPRAMVDIFEGTSGHLGDRLVAALKAGLDAGGEAGPVHSAGLQICDRVPWPVVDLRCDWTDDCPIAALDVAWRIYKPQMKDYVQRALDPRAAPSFGVLGDA